MTVRLRATLSHYPEVADFKSLLPNLAVTQALGSSYAFESRPN
jgi:hypothetical protein